MIQITLLALNLRYKNNITQHQDFRDLLHAKEDASKSHTISTDAAGNQLVFKQVQSKVHKQEISW